MNPPLSLRLAFREVRSGPLAPVLLALTLASVATTGTYAVSFRLGSAILGEASNYLAADLVVRGFERIPTAWKQRASELNLRQTETVEFASMAFVGENAMLISVKGVGEDYPLKGELLSSTAENNADSTDSLKPAAGEAWLDTRLFDALELNINQGLEIADGDFVASRQLVSEPDRASSFGALVPRALIALENVDDTGAVRPGSRVEWRFLVAGSSAAVAQLTQELEAAEMQGYDLLSPAGREGASGESIQRGLSYIRLAGTLVLLLALLAGALAARRYFSSQHTTVALFKSLGVSHRRLIALYLAIFAWICGLALLIGGAAGWLAQWWFGDFLAREFGTATEPVQPTVLLLAAITSLAGLMVVLAPMLLAAVRTEPARLLRSAEQDGTGPNVIGTAAVATTALLLFSAGLRPTAILLLVLTCLGVAAFGLSYLLGFVGSTVRNTASAAGLAGISFRHRFRANAMLLFALSAVVLPVGILAGMRQDIFASWEEQLSQGTPNFFLANVSAAEKDSIQGVLDELGADAQPFAPMLRAAWSGLRPVGGEQEPLPEDRPVNISWSAELPPGSKLTQGRWWSDEAATEVSLEDEYAEEIGAKVGDTLVAWLEGRRVELEVVSLREVNWLNLTPNFWVLVPPKLLRESSASWISSFHLSPEKTGELSRRLRAWPTANLFEIGELLEEAIDTISRLSSAISLMLTLLMLSAVLVLFEGLVFDLSERRGQTALLRVFGARGPRLQAALALELGILGVAGGVFGATGADLFLWLLSLGDSLIQTRPHWEIWLGASAICIFLLLLPGGVLFRQVLSTAPSAVMRSSDGLG